MHPKYLSIQEYTYDLPDEHIAKYPLGQRDKSKLLIYNNGNINEDTYTNLVNYLPEDALLIFNNTKVIEARILFQKETGSTIEIFCLEPHEQYADITTAMIQKGKVLWKCLVGGAKRWKDEELLTKNILSNNVDIQLNAKMLERINDYFLIELSWNDTNISFAEILHHTGSIPLPPYINREVEDSDNITYQTIYAKYQGSVAAPTAGLHFTESLFEELNKKNIQQSFVTLHVGAGTFKPVKADIMERHEMHAEFIDVNEPFIHQLIKNIDKKIIAVGTTSLRTIETLYWMGVKLSQKMKTTNPKTISIEDISIRQWDAYELETNLSAKEALEYLADWMRMKNITRLIAKTKIIIAPGYQLKVTKGLITNFHQPQSTLLLLVAAIIGNDWKKVYSYALQNNFRFLSYGDGSLLWATIN